MELKINNISIELPEKANNYLKQVISFLSSYFSRDSDIVSIILFGSHAAGYARPISDVDLLIVLSDTISNSQIKKASQYLEWLEIQENLSTPPDNSLFNRIFRILNRQTGMFVSHFLCRRENIINAQFHKIFRVSAISTLLAPNQLVLHSIYLNAVTLWGEHLIDFIKQSRFSLTQVLKSYMMNTVQVFGSLTLNFFSSQTTKRSMEAVKWSLYSCYVYKMGRAETLENIVNYFIENANINNFF